MQIAIDENKLKIEPLHSGQRANCQYCGSEMVANCGEVYAWHWKHKNLYRCDDWYESETLWHRLWKNYFPQNWREVIIINSFTNEKHIADIKTPKGIVIEIQNSSISTTQIREREKFYIEMIWVVNAISFKDNFVIRSEVSSGLRHFETDYKAAIDSCYEKYNKIEKEEKNKVEIIGKELLKIEYEIGRLKEKLNQLEVNSEKIIDFSKGIFNEWFDSQYPYSLYTQDFKNSITNTIKPQIANLAKSSKDNKLKITENENNKKFISNLKDFYYDDKQYKIIEFKHLSRTNYGKAFVISKKEVDINRPNSFFPQILKIKDELDLSKYLYKKDEYVFFMDLSEHIRDIEQKIEKLRINGQNFKMEQVCIIDEIQSLLKEWFRDESQKLRTEFDELVENKKSKSQLLLVKNEALKNLLEENEKAIEEDIQGIEKRYKAIKLKIMLSKKGKYTFRWKHERKTWKIAKCPIYFDIGEDYLLERISENQFQKIMIHDFIEQYSN